MCIRCLPVSKFRKLPEIYRMKFEEAKLSDVPEIVKMLADDALGSTREDYRIPLPDTYLRAFQEILEDTHQELIVVRGENDETIGTMQLSYLRYLTYRGGLRAQIEAVRIHREYRGEGIGKKMISWAIDRARKRGAHVLQLTTDKQRPDAVTFYSGLGFIATHEGMKLHLNS